MFLVVDLFYSTTTRWKLKRQLRTLTHPKTTSRNDCARKYDDADQRPDKGEIPVYTPSLLHKFKAEKRDHLNSTTKKWMHAVSHWSSEGSKQRNVHRP